MRLRREKEEVIRDEEDKVLGVAIAAAIILAFTGKLFAFNIFNNTDVNI